MRYLDSGTRDPATALGSWLDTELPSAAALRFQSGFFGGEVNHMLASALTRLRDATAPVWVVVGSNDQGTVAGDVAALADLIGLPREHAGLAVASYGGGYFHPKVYHIVREDGTSCAYVGSANLTQSGVGGRHVEAGIALDSRDGDDGGVLEEIGEIIEGWFGEPRAGLYLVTDAGAVAALVEERILRTQAAPKAKPAGDEKAAEKGAALATLQLLFTLPALPEDGQPQEEEAGEPEAQGGGEVEGNGRPVTTGGGLPGYILVAEGARTPTVGVDALTGVSLPGGAVGLLLELNRDSARRFFGGKGTSNITIPVATLSTIRFGLYQGKYDRPRAEYKLSYRYLGDDGVVSAGADSTNIMPYGFKPGEAGHGDVRMLVPASVRDVAAAVASAGLEPPQVGDPAILEWPTDSLPEFRLTYYDPGSEIVKQYRERLSDARSKGRSVGHSSTWLMPADRIPW